MKKLLTKRVFLFIFFSMAATAGHTQQYFFTHVPEASFKTQFARKTHPDTLLANTTNSSQKVTLPIIATNTARVKIMAADNIFFDTSNKNIAISGGSVTFGNKGLVKTNLGASYNYSNVGQQVLLQPDGSMYIVFEVGDNSSQVTKETTVITKKLANGSTDSSYGNNGLSVAVSIEAAHAVLQPDGKIIIAGSVLNSDQYDDLSDFAVARYNTNGSLDSSFDEDGIQITNFGDDNIATSVALQSDGKIVVGGYSEGFYVDYPYISIARYNANGSLDNSFSGDGIQDSSFGDKEDFIRSIAIQSDGKIVVAGSVLARYKTDGSLDNTFGADGIQSTAVDVSSVAIQTDGKIVIAGSGVARYTINGSPDSTFNSDGLQTTYFPIYSMVIQNDGKIAVAGAVLVGGNNNFAVARYNNNGSIDSTFDMDGKKYTDFNAANDYANSLAIQTNGKLVALGYTKNSARTYVAATRYNINGSLDNSFGVDGKLTDHINQGNTFYTGTAVQSNGKVIAGGYTWNGHNWDFALARYNTDGSLDNTFSGDGKQTTDFGSTDDYANSVAVQSDGKILLAGSSGDNFALARYNADGSPDNTFSKDGKQTNYFGSAGYIKKIVIQSNGKIVAGGSTLMRYNTDGSLDAGFKGSFHEINDVAIQSDGKIIAANYYSKFAISRYNSNGSPDNTFGDKGETDIGTDDGDIEGSIAIQNDGKIVIGGYLDATERDLIVSFALVRINKNGSMDKTFNGGMPVYTNFNSLDYGTSVKLQNNNKIILAGSSYNGSSYDFTILRYNTDGSLDNTFASGGIQAAPVSTANDEIADIAIAGDKLYAAGYGQYPGNFGVIATYSLQANKAPVVSLASPANNATYTAPATITLNASASDADGSITYVQFYNGATLLKTDSVSPYSFTVHNLTAGNYSFVAKATDNNGLTGNSATVAVSVIVSANKAPVINITSPENNNTYVAPATITLKAAAIDSDGTITSVKFYNGAALLYTDSVSPYTYTFSNTAAGNYKFYAKATDNKGLTSSSATVSVFIVPAVNKTPSVSITSPANNTVYTAPATITLYAHASDADGAITSVQFYNGSALLKTDNTSPYSCTINKLAAGRYSFMAKATDNNGSTSSSATVAVAVSAGTNKTPVVSITAPANNATFIAPATITLEATASDADGSVKSVQFFNGTTLLKTENTNPYTCTINNQAAGNYKFHAKVTDNTGLTNSSATVSAFVAAGAVNKAPFVSLTNPAGNTIYTAPTTITLKAAANDPDGTVASVQFYSGSVLLATDNTSPYSYTIHNLEAGNYSFVAKAIDNKGVSSSSSTIAVPVLLSSPPNKAPAAVITSPVNNAVYTTPAAITLKATASDPDGTIKNVKFFNGATLLKTDSTSPYSFTMNNASEGGYKFYATATDDKGLTNSTATVYVVVTAPSNNEKIPVTELRGSMVSSKPSSEDLKRGLYKGVSVQLVPNPAHSIVTLYTAGLQQNKQTSVSVMSVSGVVIKTMHITGSRKIPLNISSLSGGTYIIKIINGDQILYRQFVKL